MQYNISLLEDEYKIKLDDTQKDVLSSLIDFIHSKEHCICVTGSAGSSKSTLMSILYDILEENGYYTAFVAPTNKAKINIDQKGKPGRNTTTIHSLLKLRPALNILNFDASQLMFNFAVAKDNFIAYDVLIVDECSMINDELYDTLCKIYKKSKIIFVGDPSQLAAIKENHISKTFSNKTIKLNKIYRQKESKLYRLFSYLRKEPLYKFKEIYDDNGSLLICNNINEMLSTYAPLFKVSSNFKDTNLVKLISYTNKRINALNKLIRQHLGYDDEYVVGEILTGYDSCNYQPIQVHVSTKKKYTKSINIDNSMDYIIKDCSKCTWRGLNAWNLLLSNMQDENFEVKILSRFNSAEMLNNLACEMENLRLSAIKSSESQYSLKWRQFFNLYNAILTPIDLVFEDRVIKRKSLDYGYCITAHKSQSSGYSTVLIDMENILRCHNKEELRQMQYVACTRTTSNLIIYQKD